MTPFILSAGVDFVLAFLSFWALSRGTRFFSWQLFSLVSKILLLLLAAALLVDSVDHMVGPEIAASLRHSLATGLTRR